MRKANVTYDEVSAYCDQQAAAGVQPDKISCRDVIASLKCSSSTSTVNDLLKRWRQEHSQSVMSGVALNEGDLAAVYMAVKGVIASKCGERERELTGQIQEANSRLKSIAGDLEALMAENGWLTEWKVYLEEQLAEAKRTIAVLRGSLATIIDRAPSANLSSEPSLATNANNEAQRASAATQSYMVSPLPPEAFGDSHQEPALMPATGQDGMPLSTAAGNSNEGPEEKPDAQG